MDFLHLLVLGAVQGLTEFLPVSSSAHLVLVPHLLGWEDQGLVFDIALHFGTLGAVLVYFRNDVKAMFGGVFSLMLGRYRDPGARLVLNLIAATVPIAIAGLLLKHLIEAQARDVLIIGFTSIVFGLLLGHADKRAVADSDRAPEIKGVADVTIPRALFWGLFQAMAIIPGVSRSGICITAGRCMGATREASAHFASLMIIPTVTLAVLATIADTSAEAVNWHNAFSTILTGVAVSFAVGLVAIHILIGWCSRKGYWPFVVYRVALGLALLGLYASGVIH